MSSNPFSDAFLQQTVTSPKMRGDFRRSHKKNIEFGTRRFSAQRKKPANGGLLSYIVGEISRDWTGWLATQCRWPPALLVFPANREFYREFCKITGFGTPETANNDAATGLLTQIPYATKLGIILAEQGMLAREQGIQTAGSEIIAGGILISGRVAYPLKPDIDGRPHFCIF